MSRTLRMAFSLLICLTVLRPVASGAGQQNSVERDLDQVKVLYRDGRLDEAVASLRDVIAQLNRLRDQQSRTTQLAEAHLYLGLSYFAVRDESAALENFRQVVALDPGRTLDPEVYSPRVVSLFQQARADVEGARLPEPVLAPPARDESISAPLKDAVDSPVLPPGTKIRLRLSEDAPAVMGNLQTMSVERITLIDAENQNLSFPRNSVTKVEVTRGRKGHWIMGAVIGTALGAVIGVFETPGCGGNDGDCYTRGENIEYDALGAGVLGALVGALYKTDEWVEVSLDRVTTPNRTADRRVVVSFAWRY